MNFMNGPRTMRQKLVGYSTTINCAVFARFRKRWVERFITIVKGGCNNEPSHNEQTYDPDYDR